MEAVYNASFPTCDGVTAVANCLLPTPTVNFTAVPETWTANFFYE